MRMIFQIDSINLCEIISSSQSKCINQTSTLNTDRLQDAIEYGDVCNMVFLA